MGARVRDVAVFTVRASCPYRATTASRVTEGGPLTWCATSGGGELEREAGTDSAPHQVRDLGIRSTGA